ncbi:amino acid ABC transporter substrate-binding protein [Chitinimonas arctica]|uniref:Amino acid ABC transporter substrate-binding protein n=1 Tax=Chitinimonas arctica TaxID=2594795 RepID=A0A516SD34_9NEIS|nr:transporter substrate-binding domain-containing protein [Chitinimonas arctica]QDQ26072.1 amino acid ABC transporter substrate-binding protein [Chitinimonas arctica]
MKVLRRSLLLSCLFLALPAWAAERIRLANGEWPPYLSATLPHYGYASHIVSEAFKAEGITVQYDFYPWARAQEMVRTGTTDGSLVWSITAEREKFALFTDTVMAEEEVLFFLKSRQLTWKRIEDLHGLSMGRALGSKLGVWEAAVKSGAIHNETTIDIYTGFSQLLAGRSDFFPLARSVGLHVLREKFPPEVAERITFSSNVAERNEYRVMLSRQHPRNEEMVRRFNAGLQKLRRSGMLAQMEKDFYAGRYDK